MQCIQRILGIQRIQGALDSTAGIAPRGALQDLYKDAQIGASENALKGALQIARKLHLFMPLSMHKSIQNDSIKGETEEAVYAVLDCASKISFWGALKTA